MNPEIEDAFQISSRNEDKSRERSLRYLLLATAREYNSSEKVYKISNGILKDLQIESKNENWVISFPNFDIEPIQIAKSEFKFYQTKSAEVTGHFDNRGVALKIWKDIFNSSSSDSSENLMVSNSNPKAGLNYSRLLFAIAALIFAVSNFASNRYWLTTQTTIAFLIAATLFGLALTSFDKKIKGYVLVSSTLIICLAQFYFPDIGNDISLIPILVSAGVFFTFEEFNLHFKFIKPNFMSNKRVFYMSLLALSFVALYWLNRDTGWESQLIFMLSILIMEAVWESLIKKKSNNILLVLFPALTILGSVTVFVVQFEKLSAIDIVLFFVTKSISSVHFLFYSNNPRLTTLLIPASILIGASV